jgi:serine/threonine protein kinase
MSTQDDPFRTDLPQPSGAQQPHGAEPHKTSESFVGRFDTPLPVTGLVGAASTANATDDTGMSGRLTRPPGLGSGSGPVPAADGDRRLVLAGKYIIEGELARGAMGRVYLAKQTGLNRKVAIKVMSPKLGDDDFRRRFILEATGLANLNHRNIVTVFDYGETKRGMLYLVMEHIDGKTLARSLRDHGTYSVARALHIAAQLLKGLRAAHAKGMIHRDLKPSNIMVVHNDDGDVEVKILDFGVAKLFFGAQDQVVEDSTRDGMLLGTPAYMAPEQIEASGVTPKTDLYALGCVLFQLLTGRLPFPGKNDVEIMHAHLKEPVPSMSSIPGLQAVPAQVEQYIQRLMAKRPDDRYADAAAATEALRGLMQSLLAGDAAFRAQVPADMAATLASTGGDSGSRATPIPSQVPAAAREPTSPTPIPSSVEWSGPNDSNPSRVPALAPAAVGVAPPIEVARPQRGMWAAALASIALFGVGLYLWTRPHVTTMTLETLPAQLVIVDDAGRKLGTTPVTFDTKEAVLRVHVLHQGQTSPTKELAVHEGSTVVDVREWVASLTPSLPEAANVGREPATHNDDKANALDGGNTNANATNTVVDAPPRPIKAVARPQNNAARPVTRVEPAKADVAAPQAGVDIGLVDDGKGKPGIGMLDEKKPTVGTID